MRVLPAVLVALSTVAAYSLDLARDRQTPPPPAVPRPAAQPGQPVQPARDPSRRPPPEPTGTGVIRGKVVAADTGTPVRRAMVNLSMMPTPLPPGTVPTGPATTMTQTVMVNGSPMTINSQTSMNLNMVRPKSVTTDAQGGFEFRGLPAGTYRLSASPGQYSAAYLGVNYGGKKPNGFGTFDPGTPIVLANGQAFPATITLPRGSVITGRVSDENGDALARVQVYTVLFPPGSSRGQRTGSGAQTDDLGNFRIYALVPGDYVVAAEARGNTFVQPNAPPESEEDRIGFMTTFYPGTPDEASAQRVPVRAGAETPGIEIRLVTGRLFRVSGMVTDSQGRMMPRANGSIMRRTPGTTGNSSFGFNTDEQGRFQMKNIPPGNYRLTLRQQQQGPRNPDGSATEPGEFASMPLSINSDLEDLLVTTTPGATITGQIVFETGPPQLPPNQPSFQMRVNATMADPENMMGAPTPQPALVGPDLAFTMKGMLGEFLLRASAPGQYLKSVMAGTEDVTDTGREFKHGEKVTLVLTSRASILEGNITDTKGAPVTDAALLLFSEDKDSWRWNSLRTRRSGADQAGHYKMTGLLPGRYFLVALPRERLNISTQGSDPTFFEALTKEATSLVIGEDETRQVDLKVVGPGGL